MTFGVSVLVSGTRDEVSYQFGKTELTYAAGTEWYGFPRFHGRSITAEEACNAIITVGLKMGGPQSDQMNNLDRDDMLAGCTDELTDQIARGVAPLAPLPEY